MVNPSTPRTQLSTSQRQTLSAGLTYSLGILSLSSVDLARRISEEAAENPLLRVRGGSRVNPMELSETLESRISLSEHLHRQLMANNPPGRKRDIAQYLIGDLTEEGYIRSSVAELTGELRCSSAEVDHAVRLIQQCEPSGIGARNLAECIGIQLTDDGLRQKDVDVVLKHLDLFATENWGKLRKVSGMGEELARSIAVKIRGLSPYPAEQFRPLAEEVLPDVCIRKADSDEIIAYLCRDVMPELSLEEDLMRRAMKDEAAQDYIRECRRRADALIRAVNFRGKTLLQIAHLLVEVQRSFFMGDVSELKPVTRVDIARKLKVHPSTVARAVAGKFAQVNGVMYPLSVFFQRSVQSGDGETTSAYTVQHKLKAMIAAENKDNPLSDLEIVDQLLQEGVDIARRTVAKYRGCLKIPTSYDRKRKYLSQRP
ncbi:RNA polymerase factor sigma-54 [Thalassobius sp. I31.1]|uniref:RNA polymerase factor sigma-54 n=1 Tax=Thalassobius sp. I31.1 TaxID=2109912 RepID=UPI000D1BA090|nr:RNA polymerase factor sigma-54 [Thalassobius sp. I31.1]